MARLQLRWSLRAVTLIFRGKCCLVQDFQAVPGQMSLCAVPAHPLLCPALPASSSRIPPYVAGPRQGCPATPRCSLSALHCAESSMPCKCKDGDSLGIKLPLFPTCWPSPQLKPFYVGLQRVSLHFIFSVANGKCQDSLPWLHVCTAALARALAV